jgi:hypothetical protein
MLSSFIVFHGFLIFLYLYSLTIHTYLICSLIIFTPVLLSYPIISAELFIPTSSFVLFYFSKQIFSMVLQIQCNPHQNSNSILQRIRRSKVALDSNCSFNSNSLSVLMQAYLASLAFFFLVASYLTMCFYLQC